MAAVGARSSTYDTELEQLLAENARLIQLLEAHGIEWRLPPRKAAIEPEPLSTESSHRSPEDKVSLFRRLFRGRTDVYPIRWESKAGKSGYSPAYGNDKTAG